MAKRAAKQKAKAEKPAAPAAADPALPPFKEEFWPLSRLKKYERNARKHPKEQIDQLRASFRDFGQVWPILVREDGTIIAGHGRLEAARKEKLKRVKVVVATGWTEEQCRRFGLLDNRVPLNAEWDPALLGAELFDLSQAGADLADLGFSEAELEDFLKIPAAGGGGKEGLTDPDAVPDAPASPISRAGDLWLLGKHRLICGDSTVADDVTRVLGGVKPHLMVTDPPYGVEYDPNWRNEAARNSPGMGNRAIGAGAVGKVLNDDRADWSKAWELFPGDVAYVWHGALHAPLVAQSLQSAGFNIRSQIIWDKTRLVIGRGDYHWEHEPCWYVVRKSKTGHWAGDRKQTTVWRINHQKSETGHGTQKPVECMRRPIENNSTPGQAVYEPFSGSGTTIIACEMTERQCHAIELNPAYVDVAVKRWQEFTGEKARLESDGRAFEEVAAERLSKAA